MRATFLTLITMIAIAVGTRMGTAARDSQRKVALMAVKNSGGQTPADRSDKGIASVHLSKSSDDAFGTLLSILQEKGELNMRAQLGDALQELNAEQCEAFLKRVSKMGWEYDELRWPILEHWIEIDPKGSWQRIQNVVSPPEYRLLLASKDPDAAIALATNRDTNDQFGAVLRDAIAAKVGNSPLAQARFLESLPSSKTRDALIREMLLNAAQADAWETLPLFEKLPPGKLRDGMLEEITRYAADSDPQAALAFVRRQPDSAEKESAFKTVLLKLVTVNPDEAIEEANQLLANLQPGMFGVAFANKFASRLAETNLDAARVWVEALPQDVGQYPLFAVARKWAKSDPGKALDWAIAHSVNVAQPFAAERQHSLSEDLMSMAMLFHPEEGLQWLRRQPPGPDRDSLMEHAFNKRLKFQPAQLTDPNELLFSIFADLPPEAQVRSVRSFTNKRAEQGDFNLQAWVNQFPSKAVQSEAMAAGMQAIAAHNPDRAQSELDQINDPGLREIARRGVIVATGGKQPDVAAEQAMELHDPGVRYDVLSQFIPGWLGRSPEAAQAWMSQAGIPQEWRAAWQLDADLNFKTER